MYQGKLAGKTFADYNRISIIGLLMNYNLATKINENDETFI